MKVDIFPVELGFDTSYVLKADGVIAVDAGAPKKGKSFLRGLERASIRPEDVQLIVMTHGHWDHVGSASDMQAITGAKLAMHELEAPWLQKCLTPLPPGATSWGRVVASLVRVFLPLIKFPPAKVDLVLTNEGLSLSDYGIPGRVLHTPGHTLGSVSILLDSGDVFVGDLAMNKFPLRLSPGFPIFAEDQDAVVRSWKTLLEMGATTVYPAHGKPFPAEVMREAIAASA
jgi:glyoxylase-like metal-dependent hydrolase (beta-lactamase superfamily II)